ncbi:MAG: hypothetical protein JW384_02410 [Nitrosomonadaceae bacterium]|nr:hypothetical protein [Nitrosomonadaceae bacterium]
MPVPVAIKTGSVKETKIGITAPVVYEPLGDVEVTPTIVGAATSIVSS